MTAPASATRRGVCRQLRGEAAFDIIIAGGHREPGGVILGPSQWRQPFPERVPITVVRHGESQVVGEGTPLLDRKNNLRIRGMWSTTPLGEYVRTLVAQRVLREAKLEYTDTIDDAGQLVREVLGGVFTLPTGPPTVGGGAEPAAELLGLAARIYTATPAQRAVLADQVIACALALGGTAPA
ncbi:MULTISPECIES: hypothetical protein [Mycobacterium]|uniref:Uncharacterized protein n=1 Tax=Mycobacterium kiyosense TaxID=2871094 RepID=A0A9P3Q8Y4_9MYCO|nr:MULTISPECIES: hypothetical protein [Mycobacterium]BDB42832.1 hypothetical protein IWGMT90018_32780 [Mycobacterium kiyosense]BDE13929.1 hypothetical protein MKCMC460_27890 [Mycobacterium sp. 20KCMC460]GLB84619.1 hypothetical protein SRL2020028_38750 [Mycobacterium kiyosense]GLB91930.1 hypothetical protein SRL2020130_47470 [Mycobacterium kiyosense]GLB97967.1 hypothetical protein SRL2020226_47430 [Mycobacterium kiyosense]